MIERKCVCVCFSGRDDSLAKKARSLNHAAQNLHKRTGEIGAPHHHLPSWKFHGNWRLMNMLARDRAASDWDVPKVCAGNYASSLTTLGYCNHIC